MFFIIMAGMRENHKKMAVLNLLREQGQSMSMPELLVELGDRYPERTVRRWLSEMVRAGQVQRSGLKRATRYRASPTALQSNIFSAASATAIAYVSKPLFERQPVVYNKEWLSTYKPNVSSYLSKDQKALLLKAGERQAAAVGAYAKQMYNRLLVDLSYNSSRLEGNTYSLLEAESLLMNGEEVPGELDKEKIMLFNHKEAIRYLVDNAHCVLASSDVIRTVHYLLSDALVVPEYSGKYRDHSMNIGGSTYVPFSNSKSLQQQMTLICKKGEEILDPYEKSLFLLAHLSYLQAFIDVNKRTARLMANVPLIKNNVVPLSFNDVDKDAYISAMLAVYELNNIQPLVDLYIYSYLRTCKLYGVSLEAMGFDKIRAQYREQRRVMLRRIITEGLTGKVMLLYVHADIKKSIPEKDQAHVLCNLEEDLVQLSSSTIAGLDITVHQLNRWLAKR